MVTYSGRTIQRVMVRERRGARGAGGVLGLLTGGAPPAAPPPTMEARQAVMVRSTFGAKGEREETSTPRTGSMSAAQLWAAYKMSGDLRSCVDSIARRIASRDWQIEIVGDAATMPDAVRTRAESQRDFVAKRLRKPNPRDDWRTFVTKVVTDALVFWHGCWENVHARRISPDTLAPEGRGALSRLVPVHGPTIAPRLNDHGEEIGWEQTIEGGPPKRLDLDQITRLVLAPNTRSPYQEPLIETIVREVTTLVRASERSALTMDRDEHPRGFLVLSGLQRGQDVQNEGEDAAGAGHRMRVLHQMGATAAPTWLRIEQDYTEIAYKDVIQKTREVIYRVFGVSRVEMGDVTDANRSNTEGQLYVGESHLIEPLLEGLASLINEFTLPQLVAAHRGSGARVLTRFAWASTERLSPAEERDAAEAAKIRIESGQSTPNEERIRRGLRPVPGADLLRLVDGSLVQVTDPAGAAPVGRSLVFGRELARRELPSEWVDPGAFAGRRVLDLRALGEQIETYGEQVRTLWAEARAHTVAVVAAAARADRLASATLVAEVGETLGALREQWSVATSARYREVATQAAEAARVWTGEDVAGTAGARAIAYHASAMRYLDGLIEDVRGRVSGAIRRQTRAVQVASLRAETDEAEAIADLLALVEGSFNANEHRIENWSGRLVELANLVAVGAMVEASTNDQPGIGDGGADGGADGGGPVPPGGSGGGWHVQWVAVGDGRTCTTCRREAGLGIRPASTLTTTPGGATECRGRCRCVLVWWTAGEVADGTAEQV